MSADLFGTKKKQQQVFENSAASATNNNNNNSNNGTSKIPVSPLRRSASVRVRGEKDPRIRPPFSRDANRNAPPSRDANQNRPISRAPQDRRKDERPSCASGGASPSPLTTIKRGSSFMERGERRRATPSSLSLFSSSSSLQQNGARRVPSAAQGAQNLTTEPRSSGPRGPQSPPRNRSLSLSLSSSRLSNPKSPGAIAPSPKTPPTSPEGRYRSTSTNYLLDWDTESITSAVSGISVASCDHASVARNGTTFSGRSMKYVVHCNQHAGATGEDYLTPTQRAHRQVKRLKSLLQQAQNDLEQKDSDIAKLTKEVVELRLYKAALSSPEDKSNSSDAITVRESGAAADEQATPEADLVDVVAIGNHLGEMNSSYADSGHFDDCTNSSVHSKDSVHICEDLAQSPYRSKFQRETADKSVAACLGGRDHDCSEHHKLVAEYERRLQELVRTHEEESHQLKRKHNDRVDELLQRLTEINTRYWQLVPDLESAKERIRELEEQLEDACRKLQEHEKKDKETYLQMYAQGQEAARLEQEKQVMELAHQNPTRISVPELLHQLQVTQNELENIKAMYRQLVEVKSCKNKIDPEITLQFLKSAIYYFLTDRENNQGHLRAIQSILGFTPSEISNIERARQN